ncbi:hypothetical protein OAK38_01810, partial [Verrucomicrobia bacterium]|nr:hypothetical protein [Verrucomicrobiota bacterium]
MNDYLYPLTIWGVLTIWSLYIGLYRTHVDRVRAGLSPSPQEENRFSKLITSLLTTPNQDRPFHIEAALLSCLLIISGVFWFVLFFSATIRLPFLLDYKPWWLLPVGFVLAFL